MKLIKAEVLFTRRCNRSCNYCGMKRELPEAPVDLMIKGMRNLRDVADCRFLAIYGAEPVLRFDDLLTFIAAMSHEGILTTVITSEDLTEEQVKRLWDAGLRSITVSVDVVSDDYSVMEKANAGIRVAQRFSEMSEMRDIELIMTLTARNYMFVEQLVRMYGEKYWIHVDFYHEDRRQEWSKCRSVPGLRLTEEQIRDVGTVCLELKRQGYKLHPTEDIFRDMIIQPDLIAKYRWNCAGFGYENFLSWVTVDCDGTVWPCDDFQPRSRLNKDDWLYVWDVTPYRLERFKRNVFKLTQEGCCSGCYWVTHVMSHRMVQTSFGADYFAHREV